jgi:hypothetical protein
MTLEEFTKLIVNTDSCLIWFGSESDTVDYPKVNLDGVYWSAHRLAYFIINGEIPNGKEILHSCDDKRCFNPKHLFLGTRSQNMVDAYKRGLRKLAIADEEVPTIRNSPKTNFQLSLEYNVSPSTISAIRTRRNRSHI